MSQSRREPHRGFRARQSVHGYDQILLGRITDATLIGNFVWEYTCKPASVSQTASGAMPTLGMQTNARSFKAFSISELGNGGTPSYFSYGVPAADIPNGYEPKPMQIGTPVACIPWRTKNHGEFIYLIINTQAISGQCQTLTQV